jgi:lycopene beta-cyclase
MFGLSLFANASNTSKLEIMAKGTLPLAKMVGNLIQDKDR